MAIVDVAYEKWKKDFEAECPDLFKQGLLTGPETALRRDLMRTAYMAGKKAARQPAGEPVKGAVLIDVTVHLVQKGEEMDWVRDRGATLLYVIDRSVPNG
ncbi:hypothetical protein [Stenotrophomonas maltophilia]|uniref:hypothetical protein n=1 Tax=Stenotrophomonas maltophilia TaxID=40324 RepID=UPI00076C8BF9|nr:hypothetical protein [Stenotrophomonas maltophilia]KWV46089.1 hypothetical protein AS591_17180 [Stenotrophomonas maltophilia]MBA0459962.1 hypothetical protein [Stenotrophomonas maltophilia]